MNQVHPQQLTALNRETNKPCPLVIHFIQQTTRVSASDSENVDGGDI